MLRLYRTDDTRMNEYTSLAEKTVSLPLCPPQTDVEWPVIEPELPHEEVSDQ